MSTEHPASVGAARRAALEVLRHNARGPCNGLPRTAGWGYPEPYTRDLMIATLGLLVSGDEGLIASVGRVLTVLAGNQTARGHIPSLVHDARDLGASDTTPLYLLALALYRSATGQPDFLEESAQRALRWMSYQSPDDLVLVAQQPTTDWRDEQWVPGYGLYVNALVYAYLRLFRCDREAADLHRLMNRFEIRGGTRHRHVHEGLRLRRKPYYALWAFKLDGSERFDLLGNSLAILFGIASPTRAKQLIAWIEAECAALRERGDLAVELPPCLFPYIKPGDPDWRPRYERFNRPAEYHNGGVWPFVCGFYVAALVAAGRHRLARRKLAALAELARPARSCNAAFGFNEWFRASDGSPCGQDWQTWSASMYLYAAECVDREDTPFFGGLRHTRPAG